MEVGSWLLIWTEELSSGAQVEEKGSPGSCHELVMTTFRTYFYLIIHLSYSLSGS